jgi:GNAT superfamily N-acetyltransferase
MMLRSAVIEDFRSDPLRARAEVHAKDDVLLLLARSDEEDCGLVVLDLNSGDDDEAILVEIFVPPERRCRGAGSQVLTCAEDFARDAGRRRISLEAEPLDSDFDDDDAKVRLIRWYSQRGYTEIAGRYDQLEKTL